MYNNYDKLRDLANGYSIQAKTSNRYWLCLITISIISLINIDTKDLSDSIALPFNLGDVSHVDFNAIMLLMLCVTIIAFSSAFLQAQRVRLLAQKLIELIEKGQPQSEIHVQDIFDSLIHPTLNRVAPIPQFIQGKSQFLRGHKPKKIRIIVGYMLYLLLKIITWVIIYTVPTIALYQNFKLFISLNNTCGFLHIPSFFYWVICIVSASLFIVLIISDLKYTYRASMRMLCRSTRN